MWFTFEWDARKAASNRAKHGISFEEARSVFSDPLARVVSDPRHSIGEERLVLFGHSRRRRLLAVMFTERASNNVRIISARSATRRERQEYEEITR